MQISVEACHYKLPQARSTKFTKSIDLTSGAVGRGSLLGTDCGNQTDLSIHGDGSHLRGHLRMQFTE